VGLKVETHSRKVQELVDAAVYFAEQYYRIIPETCGACGTPAAQCDSDCMDAVYASEYNTAITRIHMAINAVREKAAGPPKPAAKMMLGLC